MQQCPYLSHVRVDTGTRCLLFLSTLRLRVSLTAHLPLSGCTDDAFISVSPFVGHWYSRGRPTKHLSSWRGALHTVRANDMTNSPSHWRSPRELAFLCRFAPLYLHKTLATREVETRKSEWHTLMKGYITRRKNVPASSHGRREDSIHCYEEWCRSIDCILPTSQLINKMKSAIIQLEEAMNTPFIPLSRGII